MNTTQSPAQTEHKHTPGPWHAGEVENDDDWQHANPTRCGGCDIRISAPHGLYRMQIATVYDNEANAKLIAAAPELLEVCHFALKYAEMRASKGTPLPAQLVQSLQRAITLAQKGPL